jgi:hypothetical protein
VLRLIDNHRLRGRSNRKIVVFFLRYYRKPEYDVEFEDDEAEAKIAEFLAPESKTKPTAARPVAGKPKTAG